MKRTITREKVEITIQRAINENKWKVALGWKRPRELATMIYQHLSKRGLLRK